MSLQLEFFKSYSEVEVLQMQLAEARKAQEKMRRALFARHGELAKKYVELHDRMDVIERNICKKGLFS